ncbi:MAG: hypothetical protein IKT39_02535 [Clostridia bacterium]|nr:hypothetical protein [Clostridia bacterium]
MKAVLMSIQPKWCELIASGKKTIEVRKIRPKIETPFKCYIYCTQGKMLDDILTFAEYKNGEYMGDYYANGKVIAEFVCDKIYDVMNFGMGIAFGDNGRIIEPQVMLNKSCLTETELEKYFEVCGGYAWHISDLVIYDEPKKLSEFYRWTDYDDSKNDKRPCSYCEYNAFDYSENCEYCSIDYDGEHCVHLQMKRPPQSWCYVDHPTEKGGVQE